MNNELDGQFVLTKNPGYVPEKWSVRESGGWLLATHPSLPVVDIETSSGSNLGWIIGHAINLSASILSGKTVFPVEMNDNRKERNVEKYLYKLGGRYAAIISGGGISRLYLDPGGSLSAVYSLHEPVIASTPSLMQGNGGFDDELIRTLGMPESGSYYPFGLTPYRQVRRLLPNHYLDLSSWSAVRHWPQKKELSINNETDAAVREIVGIIKNNLHAVAKAYPIHMGLTGGRDTRLLLACAREMLDKVLFFTFREKKRTIDSHVAGILARRFHLNHMFLQAEYAGNSEAEDWLYRVGHCVSGKIWQIHPTLKRLDRNRGLLAGMVALGKRHLWQVDNNIDTLKLDARGILERLHFPDSDRLLDKAEEWFSGFRGLRNSLVLDFAYVEQRLGCWGGPQMYGGDDRSVCHLWPLTHRRIFELMMRLPSEYKENRRFWIDACGLEWRELLDLPFNEYPGILGMWQTVRRYSRVALRRIKRIIH